MYINLILVNEQRSASFVSPRMVIRLIGGTLGAIVLLTLVSFYTTYRSLQHSVEGTIEDWRRTEPRYKAALQLRTDLAIRNDMFKSITGWRDTRMGWGEQLDALAAVVPARIQLTELTVTHDLFVLSNNVPARVYEMRLAGRTSSAGSEANVSELAGALRLAPFNEWIDSALIPPGRFRQDPAVKTDRIFEIVCKYKPRRFE